MPADRGPLFAIVRFITEESAIVAQGAIAAATFRELFLAPYSLRGERLRPGPEATVGGVVVATDGSTVVTVPIWVWTTGDAVQHWLCQATDDGAAPALSVAAASERDLLDDLTAALAAG